MKQTVILWGSILQHYHDQFYNIFITSEGNHVSLLLSALRILPVYFVFSSNALTLHSYAPSHKTHGLLLLVIKNFSIFSMLFQHVLCLHNILLSRPSHYLPTDGHCITSVFGLLWVILIWILMFISLKYTYGNRAMDRSVTVRLVIWKTMKMSSSMAVPYYTSTPNMALAIFYNFVNTYYYWIFYFKYPGKCEMTWHCGLVWFVSLLAMSFVFKETLI